MRWLKASTSATLLMGPALDATDGVTAETGLAPTVYLSKNGSTQTARASTSAIAHDQDGFFRVPVSSDDLDTVGHLRAQFSSAATHTPVWEDYQVMPANVYDSLVGGTDNLETDAIQWAGATVSTTWISFVVAPSNLAQLSVSTAGRTSANVTQWSTAAASTSDIALKTTLAKTTHITGFNDISSTDVDDSLTTYDAVVPADLPSNFSLFSISTAGRTSANVTQWSAAAASTSDIAIKASLAKTTHITGFNDISSTDVDDSLVAINLDHMLSVAASSSDVADESIVAQIVSKSTTAAFGSYDNTTDSLEAIRDRGDAAWTTGGGGSISDILNVQPLIPNAIDLADTATWRLGLLLFNALDDLPTTAEITPGTISIDRKAIGGTTWTAVVTDAAMSEAAGLIYYDEAFDSGTGYAAGDSIRVTLKSQKITVSANDYEISDATGRIFYTFIREAERGTDSAFLAASAPTNFANLSISTGGVVQADAQAISASTAAADSVQANIGNLDTAVSSRASSTDLPTNFAVTSISTGGVVQADAQAISASTAAADSVEANIGNLDSAVSSRASSTDLPTNFALAAISTGGAVTVGTNSDKTGYSISGTKTTLDALNDISSTDVNDQVLDVLDTDTFAELAAPPNSSAATVTQMMRWQYMRQRNALVNDGSTETLANSTGGVIGSATVSESSGVVTRAKYST